MLARRSSLTCLLLAATMSLCGCYQSPQQKLLGRWYNADMSIRFRSDGVVLFNNLDGMAKGRYVFSEEPQVAGKSTMHRNLVLDVVRNGKRELYSFDATFLADDRLRIVEVPMEGSQPQPDAIRQFALLRKAADQIVASATSGR